MKKHLFEEERSRVVVLSSLKEEDRDDSERISVSSLVLQVGRQLLVAP